MLVPWAAILVAFSGDPPAVGRTESPAVKGPTPEDLFIDRRRARAALLPAASGAPGRVATTGNEIDAFLEAGWTPDDPRAAMCSDATFCRRVYLDLLGYIPTIDEVERFLASGDRNKRAALVDELLARRAEYADHWTAYWEDALASFPGTVNGGMATHGNYTAWIRAAFEDNRPYDLFVAELIDPTMPRHKPVEWGSDNGGRRRVHYILNDSYTNTLQTAANVGQVFLGTAMKCASCHNHFENKEWPQTRFIAFAGMFAPQDLEVIRCEQHTGKIVGAAFPFEPDVPGPDDQPTADETSRLSRVAGMIADPANPLFARTIVNRLWKRYLGLGLVEPADDTRSAWPASHPALLDFLADDLVRHDFDLQRAIRMILASDAYQRSHDPSLEDAFDPANPGVPRRFATPRLRRLTAEQTIDSVNRAMHQSLTRAQRAYLGVSTPLSRSLGKPAIRNDVSTARSDDTGIVQGLELLNGGALESMLNGPLVDRAAGEAPADAARTLYLALLSRPPSGAEAGVLSDFLAESTHDRPERVRDAVWSLVASPEFQYVR